MATFPNSYVLIDAHSNVRVNYIVDKLLTPRLLSFRQISIYDEEATHAGGTTWRLSYPTWNEAFPVVVKYNSQVVAPASIDYILGSVTLSGAYDDGDNVKVTYNIDWFQVGILAGFLATAVDIINNSGETAATHYDLDNAPDNWDGVLADLAFAMCMEKLLLDYDLWYGRLIFAIGANSLDEGGGDIVGQLETLKANAEERANISLQNPKFKVGNHLARPTSIYYSAVRGMGGAGFRGAHGIPSTGKLRGWKVNRYQ